MASRHTRRSAILGLALAGCMSAAAQEPLTRSIDPATEREAVRPRIEAYSRVARDLLGESQRRTMNADHLGRMLEDDSRHVLPDGRELDKAAFLAAPAWPPLPEVVAQRIRMLDRDAAVETGMLRDKTSLLAERYTIVWKWRDGPWRIASTHRTAAAVDRPLTRPAGPQDAEDIAEAVLRHYLASTAVGPREPERWCVGVDAAEAGRNERLAARLADVGRPVVPLRECRGFSLNPIFERYTVVLLQVRNVLLQADDQAEAEFGTFAGRLDAAGGLYKLRRVDGRWNVEKYFPQWVS